MSAAHGSARRYNEENCRCGVCTDAQTERAAKGRAKRQGLEPPVHGASAYTNWGCHCQICDTAYKAMLKEKREAAGPGEHAGDLWSQEDLEVVRSKPDGRRYEYTALEAALRIGRSVAAVNNKRRASTLINSSSTAAPGRENE